MIQFEPKGDSILQARVWIKASPERVFRAWTESSEFIRWFRGSEDGRLEVHRFDCREGGGYDVTMVNGNGDRFNLTGSYLKLIPNQQIVMTWCWVPSASPMRVTVNLEAESGGSTLTLLHERFDSATERDMHRDGWSPCLQNLVNLFDLGL